MFIPEGMLGELDTLELSSTPEFHPHTLEVCTFLSELPQFRKPVVTPSYGSSFC